MLRLLVFIPFDYLRPQKLVQLGYKGILHGAYLYKLVSTQLYTGYRLEGH